MSLKKRIVRIPNALFIVLVLIELLLPNRVSSEVYSKYFIVLIAIIEVIYLFASFAEKEEEKLIMFGGGIGVIFIILIFYNLITVKFNLINERFFPPIGCVIFQFFVDYKVLWSGLLSSLNIVFSGYFIALSMALPLGLFLGYNKLLGRTAGLVSGFFGAIPPVVFIPYGIALLPSFHAASVFVIVVASFWPILNSTMSGVMNVDSNVVRAATVLDVKGFKLLFQIILPASLPQIFIGCNQGLGLSFILLTSAEMIGASQGLGYYIKTYSNFGDFKRVVLGIICVGIVVVVITFLIGKFQERLLCWKN